MNSSRHPWTPSPPVTCQIFFTHWGHPSAKVPSSHQVYGCSSLAMLSHKALLSLPHDRAYPTHLKEAHLNPGKLTHYCLITTCPYWDLALRRMQTTIHIITSGLSLSFRNTTLGGSHTAAQRSQQFKCLLMFLKLLTVGTSFSVSHWTF